MTDSLRYKDWYEKSQRDIRAARVLKENDCGNDLVAFHCQQAIEKALKGFLLWRKGELVEGHSLIYLCKQAVCFGPGLKSHLKDCAFVNQFYIETRYPADQPIQISEEQVNDCIRIAEEMYSMIVHLNS